MFKPRCGIPSIDSGLMLPEKTEFQKTELFGALKSVKQYFIYAALFSMAINILMLMPAIYMLQVYDRVITSGSLSTLAMLTLIMMFLLMGMGGFEWVRSRILVRASNKLEEMLRERVFDATFKQSLISGGLKGSSQPLSDLAGLRQFLTGNGLFAFLDAPWFPVYVLVMFMFHPAFGYVAIFGGVVLVTVAYANEKVTHKKLEDANTEAAWTSNFATKNLRNAEVIESMGMMGTIRSRWSKHSDRVLALQGSASDWAGIFTSFSKTFRIILQSLILGVGAWLAVLQEISPGMMIAGSILLGRALAPIDQMVGAWRGFATVRTQYGRLSTLLERIPTDKETMSLPDPVGRLSVESVIVAAPGSRTPILRGVSFALEAGESLGVIGSSASGKSTLARALLGIWPALSGKVRLDSADIFAWDREELGPHIGYLPQDIELFDGTIAENIARFNLVDSGRVVEAAKLVGVHELILRLPEGYDTVIGGNGGVLSGGQRQRIGLARALYGSPCLVVLDEPNSNLDDRGEQELVAAIQRMKAQGTTVVIITHRPQVLQFVDKILVLGNGSVVDFGVRGLILAKYMQAGARPAAAPANPASVPVNPAAAPVNIAPVPKPA